MSGVIRSQYYHLKGEAMVKAGFAILLLICLLPVTTSATSGTDDPRLGVGYGKKFYVPGPTSSSEYIGYILPLRDGERPEFIKPIGPILLFIKSKDQDTSKLQPRFPFYGCLKVNILVAKVETFQKKSLVIVFPKSMGVSFKLQDAVPTFVDGKTDRSWRVKMVAGTEGINYFVQALNKGQCFRSYRSYESLGYDIEPDPDENFFAAQCGEAIDPCSAE
ncbi:MAG: hypothetical protein MZV65_33300 [Chromatiales bacterium]|nr:hypothetical protein [Chromatiales bacterium]